MKHLKYFLLVMCILGTSAWAQKEARELAFSDWGIHAQPSVVSKAFSKEAVRDFLGAIASGESVIRLFLYETMINDLGWTEVQRLKSTLPGALGHIGDFSWADIDADGTYELLATRDVSGRAFYTTLVIVKQIGGTYRKQTITMHNAQTIVESLDALRIVHHGDCAICDPSCLVVLSDLDNDGMQELILPTDLVPYRGASLVPVWPSIYKWQQDAFVKDDDNFKSFYERTLLPGLENRIKALFHGKSDEERNRDVELSTQWVVRDWMVRFLGIDGQAGFQRAVRWSKSPDVVVRQNSVLVFSEIPGAESDRYLDELSSDSNRIVRGLAQSARKKRLAQKIKK